MELVVGLLENMTVVVTGAAGGMGEGIAGTCIEQGGRVILTDVRRQAVLDLASDLGHGTVGKVLDVTQPESWSRLGRWLEDSVGRPDVLVNNAGYLRALDLETTDPDTFQRTMSVNVAGPLLGIQEFARLHRRTRCDRPGSIVNISSIRGLLPSKKFAAYSASKFAIRGLSKVAAIELGPMGIRVNCVCPGPIETPMSLTNPDFVGLDWPAYIANVPLQHLGAPSDVAAAVAWLGSPMSRFVTGVDLPVDGGLSATTYSITKLGRA